MNPATTKREQVQNRLQERSKRIGSKLTAIRSDLSPASRPGRKQATPPVTIWAAVAAAMVAGIGIGLYVRGRRDASTVRRIQRKEETLGELIKDISKGERSETAAALADASLHNKPIIIQSSAGNPRPASRGRMASMLGPIATAVARPLGSMLLDAITKKLDESR